MGAIERYLDALTAFQRGEHDSAWDNLAKAVGGTQFKNSFLRDNLPNAFDREHSVHELVLRLVESEVRKRER